MGNRSVLINPHKLIQALETGSEDVTFSSKVGIKKSFLNIYLFFLDPDSGDLSIPVVNFCIPSKFEFILIFEIWTVLKNPNTVLHTSIKPIEPEWK